MFGNSLQVAYLEIRCQSNLNARVDETLANTRLPRFRLL